MIRKLLSLILLAIALIPLPAIAAGTPAARKVVDTNAIASPNPTNHEAESPDKLVWDFTNVAISNSLWLDNSVDPTASLRPFYSYLEKQNRGHETWVSEFTRRSGGLPEPARVVKWSKAVAIGIGWPSFGDPNSESPPPALASLAQQQAETIIPELKATTGLTVEFRPSTDSREKTKDYARIRIVFVPGTNLWNHFKVLNIFPRATIEDWHYQLNSLYLGAIPFTSRSKAQVDGFLLPNADNTLGLAVCRILSSLPQEMIRALISECLVRSMGLPEMSLTKPNALIGAWNRDFEETEKAPLTDGEHALIWPSDVMRKGGKEIRRYFATLPTVNRTTELPAGLTDYDRQILSILYCPKVKPGFDKYQTIIALLSNNSCISK